MVLKMQIMCLGIPSIRARKIPYLAHLADALRERFPREAPTINSKEVRRRRISLHQNDRSFKVYCEEGIQLQFLDDDASYFAKMGLLRCQIDT
jgi:hypothetical protein